MKNLIKSELGEVPSHWKVMRLEEVSLKIKSGGTPRSTESSFYGGEIPFVKIDDMTSTNKYLIETKTYITEEGLNNSNTWLIPKDSILFSIYASFGEVSINKLAVTTNQAIIAIVPNNDLISTEYLYYYLKSLKRKLRKYLKEATQKKFNRKNCKRS